MDAYAKTMIARFESTGELLHAAEKVRDAGYRDFDCHSPFPIHGMDQAMGLKRSPLGYIVGAMGAIGLIGALTLQWWTSTVDLPLEISGKPFFSFQAYVPVTFALTVLLAAFGAMFGMLALNQLPKLYHVLFNSKNFVRFSDDGFFVSIQASDPKYNDGDTRSFLEKIGGREIEIVEE
jgi:hypothetical protein